jgi:hypothetical protein
MGRYQELPVPPSVERGRLGKQMLMMQWEMMSSLRFMLTGDGYNSVSRTVLSVSLHSLTLTKCPCVAMELIKTYQD